MQNSNYQRPLSLTCVVNSIGNQTIYTCVRKVDHVEHFGAKAWAKKGGDAVDNTAAEAERIAQAEAAETARIAREAEEAARIAREAETARIAAETARIAREAETARIAAETARIAAETARIAREAEEAARIAREAETARIAAETARIAAAAIETARITAEEAAIETARITAEEAATLARETERIAESLRLQTEANTVPPRIAAAEEERYPRSVKYAELGL